MIEFKIQELNNEIDKMYGNNDELLYIITNFYFIYRIF